MSRYGPISGFPVRLLNNRLDRGANRAGTNNLAEGAERAEFRGGVQVGSTLVLNLAGPGNFAMVVKDFGRKEVDFTREQHAHDQGAYPVLVPTFPQRLNLAVSLFLLYGLNLPA